MTEEARQRTVILEDETLKQFQGGFTSIPNRILANTQISLGARMAYAMLLKYAWQEEFCFPAQDRIAQDLGVTDRSVRTFLKELRDADLITWRQQGLNRPNIYRILKLPALVSSNGGGGDSTPGPENISAPDRKHISGQDRKQASDYKDSKKNTQNVQRSNVEKPSKEESDPFEGILAQENLSPGARAAYATFKKARESGALPKPEVSKQGRARPTDGLTDEQIGLALGLQEELGDVLGHADKNAGFYRLLALDAQRQGYVDLLFRCLSETKAADVPRGTVANRPGLFTKILRQEATNRQLALPIRRSDQPHRPRP